MSKSTKLLSILAGLLALLVLLVLFGLSLPREKSEPVKIVVPDVKADELPIYVYYGTIEKINQGFLLVRNNNDELMTVKLNNQTNYLSRNSQDSIDKTSFAQLKQNDFISAFPAKRQNLRNLDEFLAQMIIVKKNNE